MDPSLKVPETNFSNDKTNSCEPVARKDTSAYKISLINSTNDGLRQWTRVADTGHASIPVAVRMSPAYTTLSSCI